ncbi:MAG: hypothetical protein COV75_06940 [Candidatus Omnitrophica bacterium CG11_big_fil_rev_8_21_14_0_20_63_9]|nr:MAG: hypothetical protein COV75_06940 [Candidatus Omnitrophica bacterium CG11_big_fil_rev_8_21_14_0_20_63_9]
MPELWLHVKVHPHAKKDVVIQHGPGRYEAWVKVKPIDGGANEAVTDLLSRVLDVPRSSLRLTKGHSGRHKIFRLLTPS